MRKNYFSIILLLVIASPLIAQNIGINSTGATPAASAMLDISSSSSGLLVPRVALTASNVASPIAAPATSLLIYNTATAGNAPNDVAPGYYYWSGSSWISFLNSASLTNIWSAFGNSGTTAGTNFIGTNDNTDLVVKTNTTEKVRITSGGAVGIGSATFDPVNPEKLLIDAHVTTSVNALYVKGDINSYFQINIKNAGSGGQSSSDVVATANNGSETSNYVDMGVNGGSYSGSIMGASNDAYLYNIGQNLLIATGTASKSLVFMTGGTTQATNERMRISGTGYVGIGNNNPNSTLSINGSLTMTFITHSGSYTILDVDYIVINTGSSATWTLPSASATPGRIYRLINQGSGNITLSRSVTTATGSTTTTLSSGASGNFEILSDGSVWRKIN